MVPLIIASILAFFVTYFTIPVIIRIALAKKLFDEPDNVRKIHLTPVPSLGGLGIFIGFILCLLLTIDITVVSEFQYYIATFLIIFFIGIKDDILVLSATKKFVVQLLVAAILVFKAHLLIDNMHGFLGINQISPVLSYPLTFFTVVVIINAFNLIDGVDGLAGSIGALTCTVFGTFFMLNDNFGYATLGYGLAASLVAFLIYNYQPAKIFMGDTGSLLLGLVNSILVIKFIEIAPHSKAYSIPSSPAIGFAVLLLPLMDTLRVFGIRILKSRSPFSPDRNHIHHLLLDSGLNHFSVTLACIIFSIITTGVAFLLQGIGTNLLIFTLSISFFFVISCLYLGNKKRAAKNLQTKKLFSLGQSKTKPFGVSSLKKRIIEVAVEDN